MFGIALILHGWPKLQHAFNWMGPSSPVPGFLQALSAFAEAGGGLAIILGLLTPLAALGIICNFIVALMMVHFPHHDPFVGMGHSWESAGHYQAIGFLLLMTGPGTLSLDARLFRPLVVPKGMVQEREKVSL